MPSLRSFSQPGVLVFTIATVLAAAALTWRLGAWDVENDEAIYTYAVERMLDTGDWLVPREIPNDFAFLEKPPLKFWLVAAPIRLGVLPRSELGFRAIDALLGAVAFGYVALLGYRLAGPAAAVGSCLLLFGLRDIVLVHGLRSNNMEASLVAGYCGGVYHFLRWREEGRRRQALATAAWFTLAFLTKFVAAAFLPMVAIASLLLPWPIQLPKPLRAALADWGWAALLVAGCVGPWFVYAWAQFGDQLVETMFRQHVFARFTGALDPTHLRPGDYYVLEIQRLLADARATWLVAAGAVLLAWRVVRDRDALAWTLVVWAALPLAIISGLSSKVVHYAYPFLPPLALAGGAALAAPIGLLKAPLERLAARLEATSARRLPAFLARPAVRTTLLAIGTLAVVVAAIALIAGSSRIVIGSVPLRNSSVLRPLVIAAVCFALARTWRHALTAIPVALLSLLPLAAARDTLAAASRPAQALRTLRDCARPLVAQGGVAGGAYAVSAATIPHPYAFYTLPLGPWEASTTLDRHAADRALLTPGAQRPVVLSGRAFSDYALLLLREGRPIPPAISAHANLVVLLPGPLGACVDDVVRAGGRSVGGAYGGAS